MLVPAARRVVFAVGVEANPETFRLLEMNLPLNGLQEKTKFSIAAGDRSRNIEFLIHSCNTGSTAAVTDSRTPEMPWANFSEPT